MRFFLFQLVFVLVILSSCDRDKPYIDCEYPDYSKCITLEPQYGYLDILLTFNDENSAIPVTIYYGQPEQNIVCLYDTVSSNKAEYVLPAQQYYSAKAEYKSGNKIIHAFDGKYMEKKSYKICDSICWVVKDVELDLRLRK